MGKRKQCEADAGFNVEKNKKKKRKDEEETASLALESNVCAEDGKTTKKLKKKMNEMVNETRHVCEEVTEVKIKKKSKKHLEQENTKSKVEKKRKKIHKTEVSEQDESVDMEKKHREEHEVEGLSPEERHTLERKLKKLRKKEEKKKSLTVEKSEMVPEEQKPTAAQLALQYLTSWSKKSAGWKFQKTRQTWLLQNMFDLEKVSDKNFSRLLSYMEGLRGVARDTTVQKGEALVRELEEQGMEEMESQQRAERARQVIQLLV